MKIKEIAKGTINAANFTVNNVISENIRLQEPKLILVHNHPSGNPSPSLEDIQTTTILMEACKLMGLKLLDHIIIGNNAYVSVLNYIN